MSRGQDRDVSQMLHHLEVLIGVNAHLRERAIDQQQQHDDAEIALLTRLGGRRVRVVASDGAMIGGALFADSTAKRPARAAVVLAGLGDELGDYDSLTVALRKSGFAVFVLDPRGSGWSVAPEFPLPDTWQGREDALSARVVTDVHDALNAFSRVARIDTSRVLLMGIGSMAPIAVRAAAAEPRIGAIALVDPWTSPVDRGAVLAAAAAAPLPAYVHVGVQARGETVFADTLLHTFAPRTSRMEDSPALQPGARAFGSRPDVTPRFVRWVAEVFSAPAKPRRAAPAGETRRAPRQRG
jgi:alpha-beta hydrolase superfamily lysophospholipase